MPEGTSAARQEEARPGVCGETVSDTLEHANTGLPNASGPDPRALAQRMAALKAAARDKGYYDVPTFEQARRVLELVAVPVAAFALLWMGGAFALVGLIVLGLHYPRTAYLGHDVAHNQWGPRDEAKARRVLGATALFQGFGAAWWVAKHELHHAFPNACKVGEDGVLRPIDGDIDSAPWVIWDKLLAEHNRRSLPGGLGGRISWLMAKFQVFMFLPLLSLARLNWSTQSIATAIREKKYQEAALCSAHWVLGFALAAYLAPSVWIGLAWFLAAQLLGGFILAFVFVLNHTGMEVYDASEAKGFYDRQARSTRNTPSSPVHDWLAGGLNSQIEHHMFPTMARRNLAKMRDATRKAMQECGYAYEELGNGEAMRAVFRTLSEAAHAV